MSEDKQDRPNIEGIKEAAQHSLEVDRLSQGVTTMMNDLVSVCNHALDVEKRLEALSHGHIPITPILKDNDTLHSLLADLVEAGELLGINADEITGTDWLRFKTALTAAKQYRESGEEGKP